MQTSSKLEELAEKIFSKLGLLNSLLPVSGSGTARDLSDIASCIERDEPGLGERVLKLFDVFLDVVLRYVPAISGLGGESLWFRFDSWELEAVMNLKVGLYEVELSLGDDPDPYVRLCTCVHLPEKYARELRDEVGSLYTEWKLTFVMIWSKGSALVDMLEDEFEIVKNLAKEGKSLERLHEIAKEIVQVLRSDKRYLLVDQMYVEVKKVLLRELREFIGDKAQNPQIG